MRYRSYKRYQEKKRAISGKKVVGIDSDQRSMRQAIHRIAPTFRKGF